MILYKRLKRTIIIFTAFLLMSCSTTDIAVNNEALSSVQIIALAPFTSLKIVAPEIYKESEDIFTSALTRLGYKVININSASSEIAQDGLTLPGLKIKELKSAAMASGAHALLYGEIIFYEEKTRTVFTHAPLILRRRGLFGADDSIKTVTEFKFQIHIQLVNLSDDTIILDIKNRYISAEKDQYMPAYTSLEEYSKYILEKMADELVKKLS